MRLEMRPTGTNGAAQQALRSCVESSRNFVARYELAVHGGALVGIHTAGPCMTGRPTSARPFSSTDAVRGTLNDNAGNQFSEPVHKIGSGPGA